MRGKNALMIQEVVLDPHKKRIAYEAKPAAGKPQGVAGVRARLIEENKEWRVKVEAHAKRQE